MEGELNLLTPDLEGFRIVKDEKGNVHLDDDSMDSFLDTSSKPKEVLFEGSYHVCVVLYSFFSNNPSLRVVETEAGIYDLDTGNVLYAYS